VINRKLTRRLEDLEARIAPPTAEPVIVDLMYVSPDGTSELAERFVISMPAESDRPWQRDSRGRQAGT
jgi:hypothetical protein